MPEMTNSPPAAVLTTVSKERKYIRMKRFSGCIPSLELNKAEYLKPKKLNSFMTMKDLKNDSKINIRSNLHNEIET